MKLKSTQIFILIVLAIQFLFTSCNKTRSNFVDFPDRENLYVSEVRETEDVFIRYPFRIRMDDGSLYVMDLHADEYYCHQFDYPSMKHIRSFAKRGQGPGEFMDAENLRITQTTTSGCWVLDANNARITCFQGDVPDSLAKEIHLDKHLIRTLDFDLFNDSMLIVPDYTGDHRFNILNPDGSINESRGRIPLKNKDQKISNAAYAQAWRGFINYHPESGLLVIATQLGEVIEIYDIPENRLVNVVYGRQGEPEFDYRGGYAFPTGIMGYSDVFVGNERIYAIFWDQSFDEIKRNMYDMYHVQGGNNIHVFDHEGNPLKHYVLDRYITGFYVDEEKNIIFGLDVNSDQPIVEFAL